MSIILVVISNIVYSQAIYQYTRDSVIRTAVGDVYILRAGDAYLKFSKANPPFDLLYPATSSNPSITQNDEGLWDIDYTRYTKHPQTTISNIVRSNFAGYLNLLKSAFDNKGQIWITVRTNSTGVFKNAEITLWAKPSIYRQIPPEVLCGLLNALEELQFTIPPEYQCISDHYFHYSVFFKDL